MKRKTNRQRGGLKDVRINRRANQRMPTYAEDLNGINPLALKVICVFLIIIEHKKEFTYKLYSIRLLNTFSGKEDIEFDVKSLKKRHHSYYILLQTGKSVLSSLPIFKL